MSVEQRINIPIYLHPLSLQSSYCCCFPCCYSLHRALAATWKLIQSSPFEANRAVPFRPNRCIFVAGIIRVRLVLMMYTKRVCQHYGAHNSSPALRFALSFWHLLPTQGPGLTCIHKYPIITKHCPPHERSKPNQNHPLNRLCASKPHHSTVANLWGNYTSTTQQLPYGVCVTEPKLERCYFCTRSQKLWTVLGRFAEEETSLET